jgi:hypothetical protein
MRLIKVLIIVVLILFPSQSRAEDRQEIINPSHYLWRQMGSFLPKEVYTASALFHTTADGHTYVAVVFDKKISGDLEFDSSEYDTQGLIVGEVGGEFENFSSGLLCGSDIGNSDINDLIYYNKLEFADFNLNGQIAHLLLVKGAWHAAGGTATGPFFTAYRFNDPDIGLWEEGWNVPVPYGIRDCDFVIKPETNCIIVWIASPKSFQTAPSDQYPIKQYLYTYDEIGLDLIKMDTTTALYDNLPGTPPFIW